MLISKFSGPTLISNTLVKIGENAGLFGYPDAPLHDMFEKGSDIGGFQPKPGRFVFELLVYLG